MLRTDNKLGYWTVYQLSKLNKRTKLYEGCGDKPIPVQLIQAPDDTMGCDLYAQMADAQLLDLHWEKDYQVDGDGESIAVMAKDHSLPDYSLIFTEEIPAGLDLDVEPLLF